MSLAKGERADDKVRREGGVRDWDYATHPFAMRWVHTVVLLVLPQTKRQQLERGHREVFRGGSVLCFDAKLRKVEVFPLEARPVAQKDVRVRPCQLSIKLDRQREDCDRCGWVKQALHIECCCEPGCLRQVFVFGEGQEGTVEVVVGDEDRGVRTWVGA